MDIIKDEGGPVDMKVIKVAKYKCQQKLLFHTRYFFRQHYNRKFIVGDHHHIICDALEKVIRGEITRLIIEVAPRYTKTELAVKNFIAHALSLNPSAKFIHLSYSDTLALDNSESVKDHVQSPSYQRLFPEVKIKKDSKAKDKWYTTEGGGILARATAGQVTGFGAGLVDEDDDLQEAIDEFLTQVDEKKGFGGAIIIDDSIKPEDADQDTIREKVNSRFDSTVRNRVNSRTTPIIVIGQRLHPNDLPGYLQRLEEEDEWHVISLPCLTVDSDGNYKALWPFKHTVAELLKMKRNNDVVFERQYQQNPRPKKGLMFPLQDLKMFNMEQLRDRLADPDAKYLAGDPANLGGDDFGALATKLIGNEIFVTDVIYNTDGEDKNKKRVVNLLIKEQIHHAGIEGIFGWLETVKEIRKMLLVVKHECEVRALRPRTAKATRINSRSSFIKNHLRFRDDWQSIPEYKKFMDNLTSYLNVQAPGVSNKRDEAPDVCEMIATYYAVTYSHIAWVVPDDEIVTE